LTRGLPGFATLWNNRARRLSHALFCD